MTDKQASPGGSKDDLKITHKLVTPSGEAGALAKLFTGRNGTVQLQPGGWTYLPAYEKYRKEYSNFEVRGCRGRKEYSNFEVRGCRGRKEYSNFEVRGCRVGEGREWVCLCIIISILMYCIIS